MNMKAAALTGAGLQLTIIFFIVKSADYFPH